MESVPQTPGGASDWADDETDVRGLDRAALTVAWEQVGAFVAEEFSQAIVRVFKRLGVHLPAPVLPVPLPKASDETGQQQHPAWHGNGNLVVPEDEEKRVKRGRGRQPTRQKRPKKLDADGNVIVRPPSLYNKFVAKHVQQVRDAAPSLLMPDVMKAISKLWKGHKEDGDDLLIPASEVLAAVEELVEARARDIAEGRVQPPKPKVPKSTRKRKGGQDGEASVPATPGPPEADEEIEEEDTEPETPAPVKNKANPAAAAVAANGQTSKQGARRKPLLNKVQQQESSDESEEEEETLRPPLRPQPASVPELDSDGAEQGVEAAVAAAVAAAERERLRRKNRNKKKKQKQRQGKQVVGRSTPGDGDEDEDEEAEESPILKPRKQNKKQRHVLHSD